MRGTAAEAPIQQRGDHVHVHFWAGFTKENASITPAELAATALGMRGAAEPPLPAHCRGHEMSVQGEAGTTPPQVQGYAFRQGGAALWQSQRDAA